MNNAAKSILFFGIYMIVVGLLVLLIPNQLLTLFSLPSTDEVWIRLGGLFSLIVGGYYLHAIKYKLIPFYYASIYGRLIFSLGIFILVILNYANPKLLIIALIDAVCAFLTKYYLKDINSSK